jgi:hypothetical protein
MIVFAINLMILANSGFYNTEFCESKDIYGLIHDEALQNCVNSSSSGEESRIISEIIEVEKKYNLPDSMKGLAVSAACRESRFNPKARGDRKFSKYNRPKAVGLYQMWSWWEKSKYGYGIDREDVRQSTNAFLKHIVKQIPKVKKNCKFRTEERIWIAAWVHAIRAPKKGGRCNQRPKHLRVLRKWQKNIKKLCEEGGC